MVPSSCSSRPPGRASASPWLASRPQRRHAPSPRRVILPVLRRGRRSGRRPSARAPPPPACRHSSPSRYGVNRSTYPG
eukprot:3675533-Prymnesium_polylepis.1